MTRACARFLALITVAESGLGGRPWACKQSASLLCRITVCNSHVSIVCNCPCHSSIHACLSTTIHVDISIVAIRVCSCFSYRLLVYISQVIVEGKTFIRKHSGWEMNMIMTVHTSGTLCHGCSPTAIDDLSLCISFSGHDVRVSVPWAIFYTSLAVTFDC